MPITFPGPFRPIDYYIKTTYLGDGDNWWLGTSGADRVDAGRGNDYISTGDGNDTIYANGNDSTWRGPGSSTYLNGGTYIDAGNGDDQVFLGTDARPSVSRFYGPDGGGSFNVHTGEGADRLNVYDVDRVEVQALDTDGAQDRFYFGSSFDGDAILHGVDSFDRVDLKGGDWRLASTGGGNVIYENTTGGSVTMTGITHGYNDPLVHI